MPETGEVVRSALKPIGEVYTTTAIDTNKDQIITATVEPANEEEIQNTITVMGGQDWELWMAALRDAGVLADGAKSVAYSYIGTDLTWPIYWHGTWAAPRKIWTAPPPPSVAIWLPRAAPPTWPCSNPW